MENRKRERIVIRKTKPVVSREQKAGFALVMITGVLAIVLGSFYMSRHLVSPFDFEYVGPRFLSVSEQRVIELDKQRVSDTDEDGLNDYDELYNYHTSPYLKDTDGDGMTDAVELEAGTDPNCIGDSCAAGPGGVFENAGNALLDSLPEYDPVDYEALIADIPTAPPAEDISTIQDLTVDEIKQLLLDNGATLEQINALSDEELMTLYKDALSSLEAGS